MAVMKLYSQEAIANVYEESRVIDSFLRKLDIDFDEDSICLYLDKKGLKVRLVFNGIKDVLLNEIEVKGFLITHFKLFYQNGLYYFSFSPYSEERVADERDNNVICSSEFNVEIIRM